VIVGKNELDAGKVALKDMRTGAQDLVTVEEVVGRMNSISHENEYKQRCFEF